MTLVYVVSLVYLHIYPLGAAINLISEELACTELDRTFPLTLDPPSKGLPDGAILIRHSSSIPPGVSKNLTSATSLVQYTPSDGSPNSLWKGTPSDNIVTKDFFNSISREISFVHPDTSHSKI